MANCCRCSEPAPIVCRTQITSADLAELIYVQGLDSNLCEKFTPLSNLLQLRDCAGNLIGFNAQVVLCSQFAANLCTALTLLSANGPVAFGTTQLVGQDCKTYVVNETPITVIDTACIDLSAGGAFGHVLSATLKIATDPENVAECRGTGIYTPSACFQIQSFAAGLPVVLGVTPMVGKDCLTHVIPETPLTVIDTPCFNFDVSGSFGHTLTGNVILSPAAGNSLVCLPDGLYATPTTLQVADTSCIDMHISGPAGSQTISADPILSVDAGNDLTCRPNGLFLSVCAKLAATAPMGPATPGVTLLVGRDCNSYTIPTAAPETPITVIDTTCINLTASGTAGHTLQANLTLDPSPENVAVCTPAGLLVDVDISAVDTNCFDMSVTEGPSGQFSISGSPKISPVAGNALTCTAQGLFVQATEGVIFLNPVDTPCMDVQINEAPAGTFAISVEPIISPAAGNGLVCTAQGLYVSGATTIVEEDTNCIDMHVVPGPGAGQVTISADPIIASSATGFGAGCNGLTCQADGLAVEPMQRMAFAFSPNGPQFGPAPMNTGDVHLFPLHVVSITNPSTCRSAIVDIIVDLTAIEMENTAIPSAASLYEQLNVGVVSASLTIPFGNFNNRHLHNDPDAIDGSDYEGVHRHIRYQIGPGETVTVTSQEFISMEIGSSPAVRAQDTTINVVINTL